MDQENQLNVDINVADQDKLTELQGVGTRLAQRIVESRPFESIEDLTRVQGISKNDVERLRPLLSISGIPEAPHALDEIAIEENQELNSDEEIEQSDTTLEDSGVEDQSPVSDEFELTEELNKGDTSIADAGYDAEDLVSDSLELSDDENLGSDESIDKSEIGDQDSLPGELEPIKEPPVTQPTYITRGGACGLVLIGGFFVVILAVAITLGIISSINQGKLNYASPSDISILQTQNDILSTQNQTITEDIDGIRNRMNNLESLSGQVSEMETEISALKEEITNLQAQTTANQAVIDELTYQLEGVHEEIQALNERGERFENFLDGLRTLMEELFPQTPEAPESEETP